MFDLNYFKEASKKQSRFKRRIDYLQSIGQDTKFVEESVNASIQNIKDGVRSFIVYGDPQSGKTGLMIALTGE